MPGLLLIFILFLSFLGLLHTYLLYPTLVRFLSRGRQNNEVRFSEEDPDWPHVSVLMAVYNEEKVIAEKLRALSALDYPSERLDIFVGSDCSSDATNAILTAHVSSGARFHFFPFEVRQGKPGVINMLADAAFLQIPAGAAHILLITDANIILEPGTLRRLVRHFKNERIAIVDAHMVHTGLHGEGIAYSENRYLSGEVLLKHREGLLWGKMMGPFGGCYALRSTHFSRVPPNFLVDDFYIAMRAFERGGDAISDLEAVCYEAVSHEWKEEFRRKARISTGNYQNLQTFTHLWWPPFNTLAFAFFSHKVLRWWGPFALVLIFLSSLGLALLWKNLLFRSLFLLVCVIYFALPLLDWALKRMGRHVLWLRNIRYFLLMNTALLAGFIRFIKGVKSNVWEPPKRNQTL